MFLEPVTTVRDVVEATDATPALVARILDEMRGTKHLENLMARMDLSEQRIDVVEERLEAISHQEQYPKVQPVQRTRVEQTRDQFGAAIVGLILLSALTFFAIAIERRVHPHTLESQITDTDGVFNIYSDGAVYKVENGHEVSASNAKSNELRQGHEMIKQFAHDSGR